MGLLSDLLAGILKGAKEPAEHRPEQQADQQGLPNILSQLLKQTQLGGIGGLLEQLQKSGLGEQVSSWLGSGANLPISADQLRDALGGDQLRDISERGGLSLDQLLEMLSRNLPQTVDQMSPHGRLEEPDAPSDGGALGDQAGLRDIR